MASRRHAARRPAAPSAHATAQRDDASTIAALRDQTTWLLERVVRLEEQQQSGPPTTTAVAQQPATNQRRPAAPAQRRSAAQHPAAMPPPAKWCPHHGLGGHNGDECRVLNGTPAANTNTATPARCGFCRNPGHTDAQCDRPCRHCGVCGQHRAVACPTLRQPAQTEPPPPCPQYPYICRPLEENYPEAVASYAWVTAPPPPGLGYAHLAAIGALLPPTGATLASSADAKLPHQLASEASGSPPPQHLPLPPAHYTVPAAAAAGLSVAVATQTSQDDLPRPSTPPNDERPPTPGANMEVA